jgi:3D (Asp-Asp-Asp) domain-containing protein
VRLRRERASVQAQLRAARRTLAIAQVQLAHRLRTLYENGEPDALEALLGATSVKDAMTALDDLERSAKLDDRIARQTRTARVHLRRIASRLATRDARLATLSDEAARSVTALTSARAERERFVATLGARQRLNETQLGSLQSRARASAARTQRLASAPPQVATADVEPSVATGDVQAGARTLTVVATGYALQGQTASGLPAAWGVAAVDPSVIPLGTRFSVPGYGEAVAADTGGAVHGAVIDLWFPTTADALAWGRRTVTITLH